MKKDVKFITEEQALRYMPNDYFQKDAFWNKVRFTIDNNKFTGNFYSSLWQGGGDGYLYELDEHDDYLVRRQNLKEGERIYRYFTRRSAFTGQVPLIKINIDKGLLYFLKEDEEGLDLIEFETKGIPVRYLNIIPREKEEYADGGYVSASWDAIKQKFDNIFWMEENGDEIFANEVKLEEAVYNWDGRPSPYKARVSFSDAKSMFLRSLTAEEKAMVDIEYDYKNVNELFGLMYEKKIMVKRKKDESKDFLDELENMNFEDDSLYMKNGGKLAWQNVQVGDKALVLSENKLGLVMKPYGRRFHLKFPDGTEKTYSAEELEFFEDEEYAEGGVTKQIQYKPTNTKKSKK